MLSHLGGALDITIMTIASSVRQILDFPALSIAGGTAPLISYNYGAGHLDIIRKAIRIMTAGTFPVYSYRMALHRRIPSLFRGNLQ